jgi:ribose 5-phosphate isomerase B
MSNSSSQKMTIAIGCDHAGFGMKERVKRLLEEEGYNVLDHGTYSEDSVDYPDFVHPVAEDVELGKAEQGIVLCGSGNGAAMAANKHQKVRAALCWNNELASLARQHNNANVLSIPARYVNEATALATVKAFLETQFEGGRHERRVAKIAIHGGDDSAEG